MQKNIAPVFIMRHVYGGVVKVSALFLLLLYLGWFAQCKSSGNQTATPIPAQTTDTTVAKPKPKTLPQTAYRIQLDANKVELPNNKGAFTYRIQHAVVEPINASEKKITFTIRAIFEGIGQGALWEENFKLVLDSGEVLSANNPKQQMVNPSTTTTKDISFTIPKTERYVRFVIMGLGGKSASIPIDLAIEQN